MYRALLARPTSGSSGRTVGGTAFAMRAGNSPTASALPFTPTVSARDGLPCRH
jgi:hypothetical protein